MYHQTTTLCCFTTAMVPRPQYRHSSYPYSHIWIPLPSSTGLSPSHSPTLSPPLHTHTLTLTHTFTTRQTGTTQQHSRSTSTAECAVGRTYSKRLHSGAPRWESVRFTAHSHGFWNVPRNPFNLRLALTHLRPYCMSYVALYWSLLLTFGPSMLGKVESAPTTATCAPIVFAQ